MPAQAGIQSIPPSPWEGLVEVNGTIPPLLLGEVGQSSDWPGEGTPLSLLRKQESKG